MKKLVLSLLASMCLFAQSAMAQEKMQAFFGYSVFYSAQQQSSYVETYLSFDAWTMNFIEQADGSYRATAEVTIVARQGEEVCYVKKYDLRSPSVASKDQLNFNFVDLQRFSLKNGIYDLELSVRDKGSNDAASEVTEKILLAYDSERPALSSVQLMSKAEPTTKENIFSRGGYDMEPYVSDFIPEQMQHLNFYYEIYNINRELGKKQFLTMAYVEEQQTGTRYEAQLNMKRQYSAPVVPVYGTLDISKLPSGNYNLVVEARNSDNELMLYKKVPFFRSNPGVEGIELSDFASTFAGAYRDEAQLNLYIDALYPLSSPNEISVAQDVIRRPGLEEKQAFLYRFWKVRYPLSAEVEWMKYKERIDYVQQTFSYPKTPGIHTDRGRVYLQYGPPDYIRDEKNFVSTHEPVGSHLESTDITERASGDPVQGRGHIYYLPYQLWRYNKIPDDDKDRVFLFWDEFRSGYYKLLNSNAKGEIRESGWERRLSRGQLPESTVGEVGQQFNRGY